MPVLALAYACEPGRGSEPGAGWQWVQLLAQRDETWVLTRANNRPQVEAGLKALPPSLQQRLHVEYVDLPEWARTWKRGRRGIHLYYLLWQLAALRRARQLVREVPVDLVWHLTLANAWVGSVGCLLGLPFVLGPVGGGARVPRGLLPLLGPAGTAHELVRTVAVGTARRVNPLARLSVRRAELVLVQNPETLRWVPRRHRHRAVVFPNVLVDPVPRRRADGPPVALYAGELRPLKGVVLAVRALLELPGWRLLVAGTGPDDRRLRALAAQLGVAGRTDFVGQLPREQLLRLMAEHADVLLFPSLRDQAGWVVAEALAAGLPVVCLDTGGPPVLGGSAVPATTPTRTAHALAERVREVAGRPVASEGWTPVARAEALDRVLAQHGLLLAGSPEPGAARPSCSA